MLQLADGDSLNNKPALLFCNYTLFRGQIGVTNIGVGPSADELLPEDRIVRLPLKATTLDRTAHKATIKR